jgi:hypothetical protein
VSKAAMVRKGAGPDLYGLTGDIEMDDSETMG